ncbi:MAG: hypothetical protein LJE68_16350 [Rhodobacter sp.]|nr:hypothetical protein [Rhodobacter sp.]
MNFDNTLKIASLTIAVLGFVFGAYQWYDAKSRELLAPFNSARQAIYIETATAAATLASARDEPTRLAALQDFNTLFYGRLHLVEDRDVIAAMGDFKACYDDPDCRDSETGALKSASLRLAKTLRASIDATWRLNE